MKITWLYHKVNTLPMDAKIQISFTQTNNHFQVAAVLVNLQLAF